MRIQGKPLPKPKDDVVVLPRGDEQIILNVRAVTDYKEFDAVCPTPTPKMTRKPGMEGPVPDLGPDYLKKVNEHSMRLQNWTMIQSLMATPGLEWEQVKLGDPMTWHLWLKELEDNGFTMAERIRIQSKIHQINGLDDALLDQARDNFLAGRLVPANRSNSQKDEQNSTSSGEPANDSESGHPTSSQSGTETQAG